MRGNASVKKSGGGGSYDDGVGYNWDIIQNYGNRTFYPYFFAYDAYPFPVLESKYPILGTATTGYATNGGNSMFRQNAKIEEILCDITITSGAGYVFQACLKLWKILKVTVDRNQVFTSWFEGDKALTYIRWGGEIGQDLDMSSCEKLDKDSITDTYNHLSTTTTGKTLTLNKNAVNIAFGIDVDDETTWAEGTEYHKLRYSRSNWSVAYK